MTDPLDRLESELAGLKPAGVPDDLKARIESALGARHGVSWPDRFLLAAMASGALAACVILATLSFPSGSSLEYPPENRATANRTWNDSPLAFARAGALADAIK